MNIHTIRHIIVASLLAFVAGLGILKLYAGSEMLTASTAVIAALAFLGVLELRKGNGSRLKPRQVKKRSHA